MENKIYYQIIGTYRDGGTKEVLGDDGKTYFLAGHLPQDGILKNGVYDRYPLYNKEANLIGKYKEDGVPYLTLNN